LIHNAIEHGLRDSGSALTISATTNTSLDDEGEGDGELIVVVADDGSGVDDPGSISESGNLGLQIVRTLTQNELQGVLEFKDNEPGMRVEIRLPFP